jgi:hypothetical protein
MLLTFLLACGPPTIILETVGPPDTGEPNATTTDTQVSTPSSPGTTPVDGPCFGSLSGQVRLGGDVVCPPCGGDLVIKIVGGEPVVLMENLVLSDVDLEAGPVAYGFEEISCDAVWISTVLDVERDGVIGPGDLLAGDAGAALTVAHGVETMVDLTLRQRVP